MSHYARTIALTFLLVAAVAAAHVTGGNAQEEGQVGERGRSGLEPPAYYDEGVTAGARPERASPSFVPWSKVAFQSLRDGNWNIYVADGSGSNPNQLTASAAAEIHPHMNRGATAIVYAHDEGDFEIYKMNVEGGDPVRLTSNESDDGRPVWSPDGTQIAFEAYRDGQPEIYVMNADGSNQRRLTAHVDFDGMPTWSPDGTQLAFISRRTGGYRIWVMNADGSGKTQISNQPYSFHPRWSPDGAQIAFDADVDGDGWQELWVINDDGSGAEMAVDPTGQWDAWAGSWSADGRYIAYTLIEFVYYRGNLYWINAYLDAWDSDTGYTVRLVNHGVEWEPRWQTADDEAPTSRVHELPDLTAARYAAVSWEGQEAGPSGLGAFDVQYRAGTGGVWQDWLLNTTDVTASFPATAGTTVSYRSRARDNAYNWESWPAGADGTTTFYDALFSGSVIDNRGVPLQEKEVTVQPEAVQSVQTDGEGVFHGHTVAAGEHVLSITSPDYGRIAETPFQAGTADGANQIFYLPPPDSLLQNGSFEEDESQPAGWSVDGSVLTRLVHDTRASGENAVAMGSVCTHLGDCAGPITRDQHYLTGADLALASDKDGNLHTLSHDSGNPETSFYYRVRSPDGAWPERILVDRVQTPNYGGFKLHLEVDNEGTVHAVWVDGEGLKHAHKEKGGSWRAPEVIDDVQYGPDPDGDVADFAVAPDNGLHLFVGDFHYERLPNGTWQNPQEAADGYVFAPLLTVGPDNALRVLWRARGADGFYLAHRARSPEGVWQPPAALPGDVDGFFPLDMGCDRQGNLHLFLLAADGQQLGHMLKPPGEPWTEHTFLGARSPIWSMAWDVDSRGTLHWVSDNQYRQYTREHGWTAPIDVAGGGDSLELEIDPKDFFHLLWADLSDRYRHQTNAMTTTVGMASVAQQATIPAEMAAPTLSFMARARQDVAGDATGLQVVVDDGISETAVFSQTLLNEWQQFWVDMEAWRGETITLSFRLNQQVDDPWLQLFLDDVSLGPAHPETWVRAAGPGAASAGETVVYEIDYGNRGAVDVVTGTLSVALPPELVFEGALRPPASTSPLTWDLGEVPAQSAGERVVVTATVANAATALQTVTARFEVAGVPAEIEAGNNVRALELLIGERVFLPVVGRP